jgi:hypothetical protein
MGSIAQIGPEVVEALSTGFVFVGAGLAFAIALGAVERFYVTVVYTWRDKPPPPRPPVVVVLPSLPSIRSRRANPVEIAPPVK